MSINPGQAVLFLENEILLYDTLAKLPHIEFMRIKRNLLFALSSSIEHPPAYSRTLQRQLQVIENNGTLFIEGDDALRLLRSKKWLLRILKRLPLERYQCICDNIQTQLTRVDHASNTEIELILKNEAALEKRLYEL